MGMKSFSKLKKKLEAKRKARDVKWENAQIDPSKFVPVTPKSLRPAESKRKPLTVKTKPKVWAHKYPIGATLRYKGFPYSPFIVSARFDSPQDGSPWYAIEIVNTVTTKNVKLIPVRTVCPEAELTPIPKGGKK
jgi:hypothetical protein